MNRISERMASVLYCVAHTDDPSLLGFVLDGMNGSLKALHKRGLIRIEMVEHAAGEIFPGSDHWSEAVVRLTPEGVEELKNWQVDT